MGFNSPGAAAADFRRRVGVVIACLTRTHLTFSSGGFLAFSRSRFVPLRGDTPLLLSVDHRIVTLRDAEGWRVVVAAYAYDVQHDRRNDPATPKTVVQFHHHPVPSTAQVPEGWVTYPHVHVETGLAPLTRKAHIPTGPVSLAAAVRFLVTQLGVAPLRPDWEAVVREDEHTPALG